MAPPQNPPAPVAPPKKDIASGLFNFDSFKQEQAKISEQKTKAEQDKARIDQNRNLLQSSANDTLDNLWNPSSAPSFNAGSQQSWNQMGGSSIQSQGQGQGQGSMMGNFGMPQQQQQPMFN